MKPNKPHYNRNLIIGGVLICMAVFVFPIGVLPTVSSNAMIDVLISVALLVIGIIFLRRRS